MTSEGFFKPETPLTKFKKQSSGSPNDRQLSSSYTAKNYRPVQKRQNKTSQKIRVSNLSEMYPQIVDSHKKATDELTADFITSVNKAN